MLVVLDQFEDYFLYHPDEEGEGSFAGEFPAIVNDPNLRVHFLLSIREDSLAKLDRFKGHIPRLFSNYVRIEHLNRAAARRAIEAPIDEWNRRRSSAYTIEPALVEAVIDATATGGLALGHGVSGRDLGRLERRARRGSVPPTRDGTAVARDRRSRLLRSDGLPAGRARRSRANRREPPARCARLARQARPGGCGRRLPLPRHPLEDEDCTPSVGPRGMDAALRARGRSRARQALPCRKRSHPSPDPTSPDGRRRHALRAVPRRPRGTDRGMARGLRPGATTPCHGSSVRASRRRPAPARRRVRHPGRMGARATKRSPERNAVGDVARARDGGERQGRRSRRAIAAPRARGTSSESERRSIERDGRGARGRPALGSDGDPARRRGWRSDDCVQPGRPNARLRRLRRHAPALGHAGANDARRAVARPHERGLGPVVQPRRKNARILELRRNRAALGCPGLRVSSASPSTPMSERCEASRSAPTVARSPSAAPTTRCGCGTCSSAGQWVPRSGVTAARS